MVLYVTMNSAVLLSQNSAYLSGTVPSNQVISSLEGKLGTGENFGPVIDCLFKKIAN
jgi:hypothetical protein